MPSFANGLDSYPAGAQQQQTDAESDLEQAISVQWSRRESPHFTNFFSINEVKEEIANPQQMVDLLKTAQVFHDMGSQALQHMAALSFLRTSPSRGGSSQELCHSFETRILENNAQIRETEEDREQLGSLLSRPVSPSDDRSSPNLARKRSLSSMLESEELDQLAAVRSYASSDSDHGVGVQSPPKLAKPDRSKIGKDLLSLRLPTSISLSLDSESSSSSRGSDLPELHETKSGSFIPFKTCKVHPSSHGNDGAESDLLFDAAVFIPISVQVRSDHEDHATHHRTNSVDDPAVDTSTHSFTEPSSPVVQDGSEQGLPPTFQFDSLKSSPKRQEVRRASHPLGGLDASRLNQHSLHMLESDTGLEAHGLQLVHLLLKCADATAKENLELAGSILRELYQGASLYGDSMQRVAAYFAEGLAARIVSKEFTHYRTLMAQPSTEDYFSAFTTLYRVAPYFQFAHFTANQAIVEALEGHSAVHVIDLDIMQGFQWPSLIQALASRPGGPPHLRITGVGKHGDILQETGRRLASFAQSFEVSFEFHSVVEEKLENLTPKRLAPRSGEAIAVNSIMQLHRLLHPTSGEKLHKFMHSLCGNLKPDVVTIVEQEANHNASSFLGRFMEALHYYAAVFDSLDASLPQQSEDRVKIEQLFYAQEIKNIVACDGDDRIERHETVDLWQQKMEMAGFYQVPLSPYAISQAKLLLQFCPCEGYRLHERNGSVSLGWQERQLLTASAWSC